MKPNDDATVEVTFGAKSSPQFVFSPPSVTMKKSGNVRLKRSGDASWTFVTGDVKDDTLNQFFPKVEGDGTRLRIRDECKDETKKSYSYFVTVALGGEQFTSPDPEIVNDPL